jgi:hypothetical protein
MQPSLIPLWRLIHPIVGTRPLTFDEIYDRAIAAAQITVSHYSLQRVLEQAYEHEWLYRGIREHTREWTYTMTSDGRASFGHIAGEPPVTQAPPLAPGPDIRRRTGDDLERHQAGAVAHLLGDFFQGHSTWAEARAQMKFLLSD